ncbi:peptidoglycan binding domain-containing protein [Streptomyces olivochromogenes]|uniref:peptidoglycan binding domain-containing protein n=1 Tax=Streptomyces olivochromogenes TaxID=1963 RepID=UPI0036DB4F4E
MSRETDSSSSGPNGRGGAAYPSGTPPYGTPMASENGADAGRSAGGTPPEERKTETTLTTRIRINIPGSRPIPPVVVRTPVGDAESPAESAGSTGAPAEAQRAVSAPVAAATATETPAEAAAAGGAPAREKTSDWFAPRKSGAPGGGPGGGSTNGAGLPGGSGPTGPAAPQGAGTPGGNGTGGTRPGAPGGANAPRPGSGGTNGAGLPGATGAGPVAPGHGGGTGSFDVSAALGNTASFPAIGSEGPGGTGGPGGSGGPGGPAGSGGEPRRDNLPYFAENFSENGRGGPAGPTGGPVTGDGPLVPPAGPGVAPGSLAAGPGGPGGRGVPGGHGAAGLGAGYPGGGLSDDTAILTPQKPAPDPGGQGYGGPVDNVSGHTLTSGIPVVPAAQNSPFGPGARTDGPLPHTPPKAPEPAPKPAASSKKPAKKKGRSKLTLLVVAVVFIGGGVYGAGLLMNRSDVPKGTTVLGVDIGGGTRDEAVKKLDDAFGANMNKALKLSVDGTTVSLKPDQAGLQFNAQDTVRAAAGSDYNPVSVIGSLFGQQRVVEPAMPVDEEKLQAALERTASGSGSASDGTIKFESGKAVAVYGKAGKGIDVAASTQAVKDAYRAQVETGTSTPVKVATTTRQPTVSNAEVDRMMKEFAQPAMSGIVIVKTDAVHSIKFGPVSLPKILGFKAVNGKLVETYDLKALKEAYGTTFDGVQIQTAGGKRAVTPQDVVTALGKVLRGKTAAERIGVIDTKAS